MKLVLAEKPSVAQSIAKVLGASEAARTDGSGRLRDPQNRGRRGVRTRSSAGFDQPVQTAAGFGDALQLHRQHERRREACRLDRADAGNRPSAEASGSVHGHGSSSVTEVFRRSMRTSLFEREATRRVPPGFFAGCFSSGSCLFVKMCYSIQFILNKQQQREL